MDSLILFNQKWQWTDFLSPDPVGFCKGRWCMTFPTFPCGSVHAVGNHPFCHNSALAHPRDLQLVSHRQSRHVHCHVPTAVKWTPEWTLLSWDLRILDKLKMNKQSQWHLSTAYQPLWNQLSDSDLTFTRPSFDRNLSEGQGKVVPSLTLRFKARAGRASPRSCFWMHYSNKEMFDEPELCLSACLMKRLRLWLGHAMWGASLNASLLRKAAAKLLSESLMKGLKRQAEAALNVCCIIQALKPCH